MSIKFNNNGTIVDVTPRVHHNGIIKIPFSGWTKKNNAIVKIYERRKPDLENDEVKQLIEGTLVNAHIPDGTLSIRTGAFSSFGMPSLKTIYIPDSVTDIESYAAALLLELESVSIGKNVMTIDSSAFVFNTNLKQVIFKGTPTKIANDVFAYSGASDASDFNIYVPWAENAVADAPWGATNATIHYNTDTANMMLQTDDNMNEIVYTLYPETYRTIIDGSITQINNNNIPRNITKFDGDAFYKNTSLQSVTIPKSVTFIGSAEFAGCTSLESINIPDSIVSIDYNAFLDCSSLSSVTIPDSVTFIGSGAFSGCSILTNLILPKNLTTIEGNLCENCVSLSEVIIYDKVTVIGEYAFSGCSSLTSINIPNSVTIIDNFAFSGAFQNNLVSINIPDSVTDIENYVFSNCTSLQSINIPGSVIRLKNYVFENCASLQSVVIGEGVGGIGIDTFSNCSKLSSIVIPSSVRSVDSDAFYGCVSLESVVFKGTISSTALNGNAFRNCTQSNLHIYVPWAEGDVENAPWGATNATIHYNYDTANLTV